MGRRVVFLESLHDVESLFTRGLRSGAAAEGWEVSVHFLRDAAENSRSEDELRREITALRPDAIAFIMDAPLAWEGLWREEPLRSVPKLSLWFDDFLRSGLTLAQPEVWRRWQAEENVSVFFHDGHWREEWARHAGGAALPVALSAEEALLIDQAPRYPELADHAVMIGTIPSRASLDEEMRAFVPPVRAWLARVAVALETAPWPLEPYALGAKLLAASPPKEKLVVEKLLADPLLRALANHQLWRWGKRAARLRGLRALAQRVPVAVLSGHGQEKFAREEELLAEIAPVHGFAFRDTTGLPASEWGGLYRSGGLQVHWVDPQSVESGAPFRLFEAAAAGVALLGDGRPGFPALFAPEEEMYYAADPEAVAERAAALLAGPREALAETGRRAREAFRSRHTWARRWQSILKEAGV